MMLQVILYALLASALLSVAGLCLERVALTRGWPQRWVWASIIAVSICYPLMAIITSPRVVEVKSMGTVNVDSSPVPILVMTPPGDPDTNTTRDFASEPAPLTSMQGIAATAPSHEAHELRSVAAAGPLQRVRAWLGAVPLPSDRSLIVAWLATSCGLLTHLLVASLLLRQRARAWPRATLRGQQVLVSDGVGPALLGSVTPRIVVPRWFLDESASTQQLALEHELQHLQRRDPLLLRVALLAVVAVPWNLPLWWQLRRLRLAIELDCDTRVLHKGAEAGEYGEVLLSITRRAALAPVGVVAMAQRASSLELRIRRLVRVPSPHAGLQAAGALVLAAALTASAVALEAPTLPPQTRAPAPPAVPAPATADQPYVMPDMSAGLMANSTMGGSLQTAVERYPELLTGRDEEGVYAVFLVLNADGSVHASDMQFTTRERVLLVDEEMLSKLPPDSASGGHTTGYGKGTPLPGGGTLRNDVRVSTQILPANFDPSRSLALVQKAVKEKHAGLMRDPLQGEIGVLTVLMSDDGRIARDHVELIKREDLRVRLPRDAEPQHFAVLGVRPDELGRIGMGFVTRRTGDTTPRPLPMPGGRNGDTLQPGGVQEMLMVLYAWPRRAGDPPLSQPTPGAIIGETQASPGRFLPFTRASAQTGPGSPGFNAQSRRVEERALAALLETYPELLRDSGREGMYTAALTLRPDGSVFRSGLRFSADNEESSRHAQELSLLLHQSGTISTDIMMKNELLPNGARLPNGVRFQFTVLPVGLDEARAEQLVREAVLASHADLLLPASSGVTNLLTVMMTDDGRIARHAVQFGSTQDVLRMSGRPEDFDYEALGIRAEEIGVFGRLMLNQQDVIDGPMDLSRMRDNLRMMVVRYAWPRRAGEPVGGFPTPQQTAPPANPSALREQAEELARQYFPDVLADPATHAGVRPWVLLTNDGAVVRTGRASLGQEDPFVASIQIGQQIPGARFAEVEFHRVPGAAGRMVSVAFVWLASGSTVQ